MPTIRNLVFKGAGVKGIAYIGALRVLERHGLMPDIRRVGGVSSGAFISAFIALGGKADDLAASISSDTFRRLLDNSVVPIRDVSRLITHFGWFCGEELARWSRSMIAKTCGREDVTFGELGEWHARDPGAYKDLSIVASNLTLQTPYIFNRVSAPDVPIWEALRASMSIPFLFAAPVDGAGNLMIDGGLVYNYPLDLYDREHDFSPEAQADSEYFVGEYSMGPKDINPETLGFMVETRDAALGARMRREIPNGSIKSFKSYLKAILGLLTDQSQGSFLTREDWRRTVFIEAMGVRATDFVIPDEMISRLIESGEHGVDEFFHRKLGAQERPVDAICEGAVS